MSRALLVLLLMISIAGADTLKVGDRSVEFDVAVDANDKPLRLASYRGRWIVVTVGAEWCAPCRKELPMWDRLAVEVRDRISFIALSLDDDIADGKKFHAKLGLSHMKLGYMPSEKSAVAATYGAATMPSTFIIDPTGLVRYVRSGFEKNDPDGEYRAMRDQIVKLTPAPKTKLDPKTCDPKASAECAKLCAAAGNPKCKPACKPGEPGCGETKPCDPKTDPTCAAKPCDPSDPKCGSDLKPCDPKTDKTCATPCDPKTDKACAKPCDPKTDKMCATTSMPPDPDPTDPDQIVDPKTCDPASIRTDCAKICDPVANKRCAAFRASGPPPSVEPIEPWKRHFTFELGMAAGFAFDDKTHTGFLAHGGAGVAITPTVRATLRLSVGTVAHEPARESIGSVMVAADYDFGRRGFIGAGLGIGVVDDNARLAIELHGGALIKRFADKHAILATVEVTRLQGDPSTTLVLAGAIYRFR